MKSEDETWLPPGPAGATVGKSDQTILAWIREGALTPDEFRKNGRFYLVQLSAVRRVAATKHPPRRGARTGGSPSSDLVSDFDDTMRLRSEVKDLQQQLQDVIDERDRLRGENRKLRDTATNLHSALGRWIGAD